MRISELTQVTLLSHFVCSPDKKREEEDLKELDAKNKITKDMVRKDCMCGGLYTHVCTPPPPPHTHTPSHPHTHAPALS